MKTHTKVFFGVLGVAAVVGIAAAGATYADGRGWDGPGWGGKHRGMGPAMIFERFDTDADGKITREEANATIDGKLQAFDADGNGSLSIDEFQGLWTEHTREMMVRGFQRLDRDGDGEVTRDEIDRPVEMAFSRMDRNEDGAIAMDEMRRKGRHHRGDDDRQRRGDDD